MNAYEKAYLAHHGIKGMKWGIRRYQTESGELTDAGKRRYGQGNKVYNKFLTKLPTTKGQMRRDVRKMRRNMIKDTYKETFSNDPALRKIDAKLLGPVGGAARLASRFNKEGFKNSMNRNKQVAKGYKSYMEGTYGDTYKKQKRRQIARAATAGAALAAIGGAAIAGSVAKKKQDPNLKYKMSRDDKKMYKQYKQMGMI